MALLGIITWCAISLLIVHPPTVQSAPISISFDNCRPAQYPGFVDRNAIETFQCCPTLPTKPIIDGLPQRTTSYTRIRRAAECTDSAYAAKLQRGYQLMRALPDSDPRSLTQQWYIHCSYCGGSFYTNSSGTVNGIDIHFNWLFYPWHRFFLYFHERILQSLLGDPSFSLSYWHWDSPYPGASCGNVGHNFPSAYAQPNVATYTGNRSENAKGNGRLKFPDLTFNPAMPATQQPLYNASAQTIINNNLNIMYQAMISGGTTADTFIGLPYRDGDVRGGGGGGSLELSAHGSIHFWAGKDPPVYVDLGSLPTSSRDPAFFSHHSNMDRLLSWKSHGKTKISEGFHIADTQKRDPMGPISSTYFYWQVWRTLGGSRQYSSDPDFLDASFLFYDENKDLRRVKVRDCLETSNLGYIYQQSDNAWQVPRSTRCSNTTDADMLAQAQTWPVPTRNSKGLYSLQVGQEFMMVINRPANPSGDQEFLSVTGIQIDRTLNTGFDMYVMLLDPQNSPTPTSCAEYVGRFLNMAQSKRVGDLNGQLTWTASVTDTFIQLNAVAPPSRVVVTLVPLESTSCTGTTCNASIRFNSVTIRT